MISRRRPLLLAVALVLVVLYPLWSFVTIYSQANKIATQRNRSRANELINVAQDIKQLVQDNRFSHLEDRMKIGLEFNEIDAVSVLRQDGSPVLLLDPQSLLPHLQVPQREHILFAGATTYLEYEVDGYVVRVASRDVTEKYVWRFIRENILLILRDVAIVLLMCGFTVSYFMKDIAQILLNLRSGRNRGLPSMRSRTEEGEVLRKSIETMSASLSDLENQNRQLRAQVLPALNSELMSGRKPPYEFDCTLVRVDVNNFSHIFTTYPVEAFMAVINLFFEDVTEIVSRYHGYVYEFVGDEVIFYFKDSEHPNSALTAMAALRDINEMAVRLDAQVKTAHGYHFRIKSSLSHGRLRFGPQVTGFSLAGAILIETVRILSQISDKEDNVIFYDKHIADSIAPLFKSRSQKTVLLKGLSEHRDLYSYVSSCALDEILAQTTPATADQLNYFRRDRDLIQILDYLRKFAATIDIKVFLSIARRLRNFKVPRPSKGVIVTYHRLLEGLIHKCESSSGCEDDLFRLSSALTLALHLLSPEAFESDCKPLFKTCLSFSDRRVVANSLDVFSHFTSLDEDVVFRDLLKAKDNRVVANALVKDGLKGLTRPVVKRLAKMIDSKDPNFIASGLYALGELARFHRERNMIHYETNVGFQALVKCLRRFVAHQNDMIRRQSLIAARKTQDTTTREAIEAYYLEAASPNVKTEIEKLYLRPDGNPVAPTKDEQNRSAA